MYTTKYDINDVWFSNDINVWNNALDEYYHRIELNNKAQLEIEYKLEKIQASAIALYSLEDFYAFIVNDYFKWKFNPRDCKSMQNKFCTYYVENQHLNELNEIKQKLFSFDLSNIVQGLKIVTNMKCLRVIAGSGLLSILFPDYYGTVDRFVIQTLKQINGLPEHDKIATIDISNPSIKDGVFLINIMRKKADELNQLTYSSKWRPRDIDKILWTLRNENKPSKEFLKMSFQNANLRKSTKNDIAMTHLKHRFALYLKESQRKEERIKEDCSWAFAHYNHNIGIDFWDSLRTDEKIQECHKCYFELALKGGFKGNGVKDPRGYAATYISSVKRLKEFFDHKYGGVDNYLSTLDN